MEPVETIVFFHETLAKVLHFVEHRISSLQLSVEVNLVGCADKSRSNLTPNLGLEVKRGWAIDVLTAMSGSLEHGWLDPRLCEAGHRMTMRMRYLENALQSTVRLWEGYGRVMGCVIESWHVTRQVLYRVKGKVQLRNHCVPDDHCLQLLCGEQPHFG